MARPERNDVDYFPHPVKHGKKMFYIRNKFKNDGYTVWMVLLEQLGAADYHFLDLQDETELMYLSSECMVNKDTLIEIIQDLTRLKEFDKELWEEEMILFNQKFIDSIQDAYKKRQNNCIDKNSLLLLLQSKGRLKQVKSDTKQQKSNIKGSNKPQRIGKDRKEKKRIFIQPTLEEVKLFFKEKGYTENSAIKAFNHYDLADWKDTNGKQVLNWKQKMNTVWFKEENKINKQHSNYI